ncbi:Predicted arabinose efflux permease, MFS family [Desulfuromusa kysingii]|uniref:Predicted arabinose efflux permease, MFS family n=1 Tax=Desulfuromusa kysingii TaxID=37625 RepID=A0A1H3VIY2_9BACT|nr:MFS transporter [Desulfuromusa kysingii]SDZ74730.1 Predicted arabinose efflux permease, MFS family [Desulfuromusa kysingii]
MSIRTTFRQLLFPVFLPTFCAFVSLRASLILLPLYILNQGYGVTLAASIISIRGIGMLFMDLPAGFLVSRLGDKGGMLVGNVAAALSLFLFATFDSPVMFVLISLLSGAAFSVMMLSRLSYVGKKCDPHERGRVIAFMASLQRIGGIIGPIGGGFIATFFGFVPALIALGAFALLAALNILICCENTPCCQNREMRSHAFVRTLRENKRIFLTSGIGAIGITSLRGASPLLVTLFGSVLELTPAEIGFFASLATILEFIMFLPAGYIMDKWGRKFTIIPGTLIMAVSLVILTYSNNLAGYVVGTLIMAFGNGLATGVIMSIAADLAPENYRGQFLGVWRFVCDLGFSGGPLFITGIMSFIGLGASAVVLGGVSSCFAVVMWVFAKESMVKE